MFIKPTRKHYTEVPNHFSKKKKIIEVSLQKNCSPLDRIIYVISYVFSFILPANTIDILSTTVKSKPFYRRPR